ncbi:sensor histidine kinase [Cellulomonas oligotrophica]|uniref:Histidine kinase n=1 Tax=Cellulomonas oligotrophica TaxID=931536 RepID=A0A7Y9FHH2_9CELL|nr:GAF domain-containing protein [Cellulomonas oligotrophica]NYD87007.1 signal transduction histidine kinase [Cellulomonas oligotrophica]GIG32207.1 histidine kinase [Cellulomonas oligotrophica]
MGPTSQDVDGTQATAQLLAAILDLAGDLDTPSLLERFVAASTALTGARYGAINIVDDEGASQTFVQSGVDDATVAALGHAPHAWGVLGSIPDVGVLRLEDLTQHPAFRGLPPGHPPMGSFLGAAVRVRGARYGTLYLSEKPGGFDAADEQVVLSLAAAAAVAVQNAQLYERERRRREWVSAGQEITTMLLEGTDPEDVLDRIAGAARTIGGADVAVLALPSPDLGLLVEFVDGAAPGALLGIDVSADVRVHTAFDTGEGMLVGALCDADGVEPALRTYGPALVAPLHASGQGVGVLLLLRARGAVPFTDDDLALAQSFAGQAALAFVLAEAQRLRGQAVLSDERTRIARDLHDLAIQQLFAAGMQIEGVRRDHVPEGPVAQVLEEAVGHVDAGIRQIRVIVRTLDDPGATVPLVQRVRSEVELARTSLGFTPALRVDVDGRVVPLGAPDPVDERLIDDLVAPGRANNVVAVVREGLSNVARHARSAAVSVRLVVVSGTGGSVTVEVEDDGVGVPPSPTRASGTRNLAQRAEESGGTFSLLRPPSGRGALLRWTAPLD